MFVAHASEPQMRQVMDIPLDGAAWRDLHHLASRSTIRGLPKSEVPEKTPGGRDGTSDCVETRIAGVHDVVRRDNIGSEASWRGTGDVVKVVRFMREFARTAQDIGRDGGVAATLSDADRVKHSNVAEDSQVQSDASLPLGDSVPGARFIRPTVEECRAALDDERPLRLTIGLPAPHIYDRFRGALHALAAARQPCIALCAVRHLTLGRKQKHDLAEFIGLHMDARGVVDKVEACDVSDGPFAACLAAELVGERLIGSANARERVVPFVFWPAEQPGPPDVTEKADAVPSDGNQIRDGG
jgi:hypothetical protein